MTARPGGGRSASIAPARRAFPSNSVRLIPGTGEFYASAWINRHPAPRFYPNMVTLSGENDAAMQLAHVRELMALGLPSGWAVKDSFCALDLNPLGFQRLFEATWLWRSPVPVKARSIDRSIRWTRVQNPAELSAWEAAWGGEPVNDLARPGGRLFPPALLAEPDILFLAASTGEKIVAGAIANRTGEVVGLSNVFGPPEQGEWVWAGCVAAGQDHFPGLPLVGYERGPALAAAQAAGFEPIQTLRVWVRG